MHPDLSEMAQAIATGQASARRCFDDSLAAANQEANRHTFVRRFDAIGQAQAAAVDALHAAGAPLPPLAGLSVSIKDLFDVAGQPTTAAAASMHDAAPAAADALAVARLRSAGAAFIGHTNMTEFAYSGVGLNPHFGTPPNPVTAALGHTPRVPGGSTSGGAVSVATGAAWAALGSDTGGSIRIPAALQGLVGFKSTQRLVPLEGCIPLSPSLDTACAITRSVRDAVLLHELLAARKVAPLARPLAALRLAVPRTLLLDGVDNAVGQAFDAALRRLRAAGATIVEIDLPALSQLAPLNKDGGLPAAESWAWHRGRLVVLEASYDPRVASRIRRGEAISAADYLDLLRARREWAATLTADIAGFDALLSPTVPLVAPPLQPVIDNTGAFFAINSLLLRNPAVVNLLDGCALSLPCHEPGGWPVGLMVWGPALADDRILGIGLAIEAALAAGF